MAVVDFSKLIKKYKNKWIALTPDNKKLIASSDTLKQVLNLAEKRGITNPSVLKVPHIDSPFVG